MPFYSKQNVTPLKKQELKYIPFEDIAICKPTELTNFGSDHNLKAHSSWLLPQIDALVASMPVTRKNGFIDTEAFIRDNFNTPFLKGIWRILVKLTRSALIKQQTETPNYCSLVPLILAAHKRYNGIKYMEWSVEGLELAVESKLWEAMTCDEVPELDNDRLLQLRELGLTSASGINKGIVKSPLSTWTLTGLKGTELAHLPPLANTMLCQIWCAHPKIRNEYMVLDPKLWDTIPAALITGDVLEAPKKFTTKNSPWKPEQAEDVPW